MNWGLDQVTVDFGVSRALDAISLNVDPGQIAVVVGGDGAGKTTLCRTVVGLEEPANGVISRPRRTGFQPATSGVWRDLTVLENLQFVARVYRLDSTHARSRITELLEMTNLDAASDRLGRRLSGGMRQKLGVAMAVLSEPELLVLDEPTTGVDPVSRLELWSFINLSAKEGKAVIVTTTYVDEASRADTVMAMEDGKQLASGSLEDVLASMPGAVYVSGQREGVASWRRGQNWRVWSADGSNPGGLELAATDLADVVTVAELREEATS